LLEKVGAKTFVCVEDFDADEAVVFPVEGESVDAGRERGRDGTVALGMMGGAGTLIR
jgi:hypothetical protein